MKGRGIALGVVCLIVGMSLGASLTSTAHDQSCDWGFRSTEQFLPDESNGFASAADAAAGAVAQSDELITTPEQLDAVGEDRLVEVTTNRSGETAFNLYLEDVHRGMVAVLELADGTFVPTAVSLCWGVK